MIKKFLKLRHESNCVLGELQANHLLLKNKISNQTNEFFILFLSFGVLTSFKTTRKMLYKLLKCFW